MAEQQAGAISTETTGPASASKAPSNKNEKIGEVVSTKMQKTIVVVVVRKVPHPLYKRIVTKKTKFYAHDEEESAKSGDVVRIVEHRPMSKLKRWILGDVIRRAVQVGIEPSALDVQVEGKAGAQKSTSGKTGGGKAAAQKGSKRKKGKTS
ncbi:MAG: 30S ribosomal protein S17 [Bryobacteraceae bacterium]